MIGARIKQALAATNGGPGLTVDELCEQLHADRSSVRSALARLIYEEGSVTAIRGPGPNGEPGGAPPGTTQHKLGDPTALILIG